MDNIRHGCIVGQIAMIKLKTLFIGTLILVAIARYPWQVELSKAPLLVPKTNSLHPSSKVAVNELPEDVFPFSPEKWQGHYGCAKDGAKYIGFSMQTSLNLAIFRIGNNDHVFMLGDELEGTSSGERIIWIDSARVITRNNIKISVLCRENDNNESFSASSLSTMNREKKHTIKNETFLQDLNAGKINNQTNIINSEIYNSPIGSVATVTNSTGNVVGYRLQDCKKYCWLLKQLSFEPDDVITELQGISAERLSEEQIKNLFINQKSDIQISVVRKGHLHIIKLPWAKISPYVRYIK